nr:protein arginine N-methyltransferase 3 zinc finger domain [Cressdnaviricota sp.]
MFFFISEHSAPFYQTIRVISHFRRHVRNGKPLTHIYQVKLFCVLEDYKKIKIYSVFSKTQ